MSIELSSDRYSRRVPVASDSVVTDYLVYCNCEVHKRCTIKLQDFPAGLFPQFINKVVEYLNASTVAEKLAGIE